MTTTLRAFRIDDTEAVVAVLEDTFRRTWAPAISAAALRDWRDADKARAYVREHGTAFVLAEVDARVVGMVHWQNDFIDAIHVLGSHARRGLGRLLLAAAEARIAAAGHARIRLETDTFNGDSRAFYRACGYAEIGQYPDREWNSGLVTVLLEKTIA